MLAILDRLSTAQGKLEDLKALEDLADKIKKGSLCGLGKTAPNPVLTSMHYFRDEYIAHINGHCPAKKCKALIRYTIDDSCIGCTKCAQNCPVDAIENKPHVLHKINNELCIKCDVCRQVCPIDSVKVVS